jgi:DnaK suppressor protein
MDLPTQAHLTTLRELLSYRRQQLQSEVRAAELARDDTLAVTTHEVADRKDEAQQRQFAEIDEAQLRRDRDELAEVEAALSRLDAGVYGDCQDCGEPIALQRLTVLPAARRCAPCQAASEQDPARSRMH